MVVPVGTQPRRQRGEKGKNVEGKVYEHDVNAPVVCERHMSVEHVSVVELAPLYGPIKK